jgi:hypothetical protein
VLTVAMETADLNLLLSFSVSVFLNVVVVITIVVFSQDGADSPELNPRRTKKEN